MQIHHPPGPQRPFCLLIKAICHLDLDFFFFIILIFPSVFSLSGRLLDATKKYMFVFLLAGCEVVISALVLATCNFLCIKKSSAPPDKFESITMTDDTKLEGISHPVALGNEEQGGPRPGPEKEADKDAAEEKKVGEVKAETEPSQEEAERFLTEAQQNGGISPGPETSM